MAFAERALKHLLARRERRLTVANELHDKLLQVIAERAADPELANVPGGKTGLITKRLKSIGRSNDFRVVPVYEVDTGTLREIRAIHEQVAEELGQRPNKDEVHDVNWARTAPTINVTFVESAKEKLLGNLLLGGSDRGV